MLAGFPLVFRERLLGSEAETACRMLPMLNFVLKSSEGIVDAWKVREGEKSGGKGRNMTEETFLIIYWLPSSREIPKSMRDMGEPWSVYEHMNSFGCSRALESMVRSGQHLEDVGGLVLGLPRDGVAPAE